MDKRNGILNISSSILSRIILLLAALLVRRLLIQYIGNEVNGLNSLYTSIIGMLTVAELGVGSAISFSMYSPIIHGDKRQVAGLYRLYQRAYWIIGTVIFVGGILIMPFLPRMINDYDKLTVNTYLTFFLTLCSVVLSYVYSAKTSLIEAHKKNYITTGIVSLAKLIRYFLQGVVILIWSSYTVFIVCQIIETLLVWVLTEVATRRQYKEIIVAHEWISRDTLDEVIKNIKAMFMHKIGSVLVMTTDSIIISAFAGVVVLGKYSNYAFIAEIMAGTIALFFTPLISIVGHLCAAEIPEVRKKYFSTFYCENYLLGVVFFLGYYAVIDPLVSLCFGEGLEISDAIVYCIALNGFIQYMRNAWLLFHNATETFYYDRWKPVVEGVINVVLSLAFVQYLPEKYCVAGVIVATIITNLVINFTVEPYVVFRYVFDSSARRFCIMNYVHIAVFAGALLAVSGLNQRRNDHLTEFFINGFISVGVTLVAIVIVGILDKEFRSELIKMMQNMKKWLPKSVRKPLKKLYTECKQTNFRIVSKLLPRDKSVYCPCCGLRFKRFIALDFITQPEMYDTRRYEGVDQEIICPYCYSLPRHRILASWCEENEELLRSADILYFALENSMTMWMKAHGIECTTADLYAEADLKLDIQDTGLDEGSYDLIICNHVLEHVIDYRAGMRELYRILKPNGSLICSFPMDPRIEYVDEDESIVSDEARINRFGQNDHLRVFGMKSGQLLEVVRFRVETISGEDFDDTILPVVGPADYDMNCLFLCRKDAE